MNFSNNDPSPYEVLGLPTDATEELVRNTYKKLIEMYHPDILEGDQDFAKPKIILLKAAFEYLENCNFNHAGSTNHTKDNFDNAAAPNAEQNSRNGSNLVLIFGSIFCVVMIGIGFWLYSIKVEHDKRKLQEMVAGLVEERLSGKKTAITPSIGSSETTAQSMKKTVITLDDGRRYVVYAKANASIKELANLASKRSAYLLDKNEDFEDVSLYQVEWIDGRVFAVLAPNNATEEEVVERVKLRRAYNLTNISASQIRGAN